MEHARGAERHGDGHDGRRRLHAERQDGAHEQEEQRRPDARVVEVGEEGVHGLGILAFHGRLARGFQRAQTQEEEGHAEEEVADDAVLLHVDEDDAEEEHGIDVVRNVERKSQRHDPGRDGRPDVGTHDDRDGLHQREQARVDKRHGHQRGGRRRLDGCGYEHTGEHTGEAVGGHSPENMAQLRAGHLLKGVAHRLHTKHEKCERTE